MADISAIDKQLLEDAFGMRSGYVLDFTDSSFKSFFEDFGININDDKYFANGNSKANRFRTFCKLDTNDIVAKVITAMADMVIRKDLVILTRGGVLPEARQIMEARRTEMNMVKDIAKGLSADAAPQQKSDKVHLDNNFSLSIRPEIFQHIKTYLENRDYFHAVDEAYKIVRNKLEELTGHQRAVEVFNQNAESNKFYETLFGDCPATGTYKADFYRGIGYLHLAVQFLRNEKAHRLAEEIDPNIAMHYITLASLAYELITNNSVPAQN